MNRHDYYYDRRLGAIADGLCGRCAVRVPMQGRFMCEHCLIISRQQKARRSKQSLAKDRRSYYERCKVNGICPGCGRNASPGFVRCQACKEQARRKASSRRANKGIYGGAA